MLGIGIDVVEVVRIRESLDRFGGRFLERIFTEEERKYCLSQKRPEMNLAARFAAKEAISKAFGTGIGRDLSWLDLEICRGASGEPVVHLSEKGEAYALSRGAGEIKISLTHARHYAAANAVLLAR